MGVSLKTEQRRSHTAASSFGPWVRRAEGCRGTRQIKPSVQVPVKPLRPPSLPLIGQVFPDHSSFSVLRETPMAFSCDNFKKLKCYSGSNSLWLMLFLLFQTELLEPLLDFFDFLSEVGQDLFGHFFFGFLFELFQGIKE